MQRARFTGTEAVQSAMSTGELIHVPSCPVEIEDLVPVAAPHDIGRVETTLQYLQPARHPGGHQCGRGAASRTDGDIAVNVDVPAADLRRFEFFHQTRQCVSQRIRVLLATDRYQMECVHGTENGAGHLDTPLVDR